MVRPVKDCGHDSPCACTKFRREPISDQEIEALLAVEREDPDFDQIDGEDEHIHGAMCAFGWCDIDDGGLR